MKTLIFMLFIAFSFKSFSSSEINSGNNNEQQCLNYLFAGLWSIDNKDFILSKEYIKEAVELSKLTQNDKLKGYAHASLGLFFQKKFPRANDIPGRQINFVTALRYLKSSGNAKNSDVFISKVIDELINDRKFELSYEKFDDFYKIITKENPENISTFQLLFIRNLTNDSTNIKQKIDKINNYIYFSKDNDLLIARNHANYGFASLNLINTSIQRGQSTKYSLEKSLKYYYRSKINVDENLVPFQSPEIFVVENAVTNNFNIKNLNSGKDKEYINDQENDKEGFLYWAENCPNTPWASIEIGASGVKLSVICLKNDKDGEYDFGFLKITNKDTKFSDFSELTTQQTSEVVKEYYNIALNEYSLPEEQIFITFSSGSADVARKNNKMNDLENFRKRLIITYSKPDIEILTVKEEARLTLLGIVTQSIRDKIYKAGIIDIGTGNVKGGYCENHNCDENNFRYFNSEWANKNIYNKVAKIVPDIKTTQDAQKFADEVQKFVRGLPITEISNQFSSIGIRNKSEIFLTGGIFWAIATIQYPQKIITKNLTYANLTLDDIISYKNKMINNFADYVDPQGYTESESAGIRDATTKFDQVKGIIGAVLAEEMIKDLEKSQIKKHYYWSKYSLVGWTTGVILAKSK